VLDRPARPWPAFGLAVLLILIGSFAWRAALALWGPASSSLEPSYLPALEVARDRYPFDAAPLEVMERVRPSVAILGDSMALRVDSDRLATRLSQPVLSFMRYGTGSASWYLRLKNYIVASSVHPRWVLVFFRDTQLTDPLFRATGADRYLLDPEARESEPELNTVMQAQTRNPWFKAQIAIDQLFAASRARDWGEPALRRSVARALVAGDPDGLIAEVNGVFDRSNFRALFGADLAEAEAESLAFNRRVRGSVLPLMLDLAQQHELRLCFVRVLRRPVHGHAAAESAPLRAYVRDLRAYLTGRGAYLLDDRDEPRFATLAYDDGDHVLDEDIPKYTDLFAERLKGLGP
jgi:hypothetical protein